MADQVFLDEGGVTVTEDQFLVSGQSYRIRDIIRVGVVRKRPSRLGPILFAMIGLAVWLSAESPYLYMGLGVVGLAWYWVTRLKTNLTVLLDTLDGEEKALQSKDELWVEKVVKALNDAKQARK